MKFFPVYLIMFFALFIYGTECFENRNYPKGYAFWDNYGFSVLEKYQGVSNENPFGKNDTINMQVLAIKDGWMQVKRDDNSITSYRINGAIVANYNWVKL